MSIEHSQVGAWHTLYGIPVAELCCMEIKAGVPVETDAKEVSGVDPRG